MPIFPGLIHPAEGRWRAYLDGELEPDELEAMALHLGRCVKCRSRFQQVQETAAFAAARLGALKAVAEVAPVPALPDTLEAVAEAAPDPAVHRLRKGAPAWPRVAVRIAAAAAVLLVFGSLASPTLRAKAAEWVTVLRLRDSRVVHLTADDVRRLGGSPFVLPGLNSNLLKKLVQIEVVTPARLQQNRPLSAVIADGFKAPGFIPAGYQPSTGTVTSAQESIVRVDVDAVNRLLAQTAIRERVPEELKGQAIRVKTGVATAFVYRKGSQTVRLMQGSLPELSAAGSIDMNRVLGTVAAIFGEQLGLSPSLTAQLQSLDLSRTLPLPVIDGAGEEVRVGEGAATYVPGDSAVLAWLAGPHIYVIEGPLSREELLRMAESIGN